MRSIFYQEFRRARDGDLPVTFMLVEVLGGMQSALEGLNVYAALQLACEQAGLCTEENPITEPQATALLKRLNERPEADPQVAKAPPPGGRKRSYGTEFLAKFSKLPTEGKCLFAADYDYEEARKLYCVYDKSVSEKIISDKIETCFAARQMDYEAVVLGMGGSFKGGGQEETDHAEGLEPGSEEHVNAAMAFMSMQHQFKRK